MLRTTLAAVAAVVLGSAAPAATLGGIFTGYFALGDSLTDDGKAPMLPPPSLGGRFTNGPTYAEYVAARFTDRGLFAANLAIRGATAGDLNDNDPNYLAADATFGTNSFALGTLDRQVALLAGSGIAALGGPDPLVSLLFGSNDFFQRAGDPGFNPLAVVGDIVDGVAAIAALGPQFDDFLVINLPDLAATPSNAGLSPVESAALTGAVSFFNVALEAALNGLAATKGLNIQIFDLFSANNALLMEAASLGLRLDTPCTVSIADTDPAKFNLCPTPEAADGFYYVDAVHPNAVVHRIFGEQVAAQVDDRLPSPIPLPAGLPLLAVALGGLVLFRRGTA